MKRRVWPIAWIGVIFLVKVSGAAGQPAVNPPIPEKVPVYQPKFYPFDGGERAVYKASWNGIPVGHDGDRDYFSIDRWQEILQRAR